MSWKNNIRNVLMGATYREHPVVAPNEVISPLVPAPLEAPEPVMAMEEALISALRRAEFLADAPVLSPENPTVREATFRDRFVPPTTTAQAETLARLHMDAYAPVAPRPAPLLTSPEMDRAEKLAERRSYQGLTPVMRRMAE